MYYLEEKLFLLWDTGLVCQVVLILQNSSILLAVVWLLSLANENAVAGSPQSGIQ